MGKLRIAQTLARAGLHLEATTVRQMLRETPDSKEPVEAALAEEFDESIIVSTRVVKAKRPDHIWHLNLTVIPTTAGFWVPWLPFSRLLRWPFCWWVAVVIDQFSRRVCGFSLFRRCRRRSRSATSSIELQDGPKPSHRASSRTKAGSSSPRPSRAGTASLTSDPGYSEVGKKGSVAAIEQFIRSMKAECCRCILVPLRLEAMREELACYVTWYNTIAHTKDWMG